MGSGEERAASTPDRRFLAGLTAISAVGLGLRLHVWHLYADAWDPCEYTWAVQDHHLPHSPYFGLLWLGLAVSRLLPADVALSSISLVGGVLAVPLLGWYVWRRTRREVAGWGAALGLAVSPVCVWHSGIQEVYALQTALALGAAAAFGGPGSGRAWAGGLLAGAALATHNATVLLAPALLLFALEPVGTRKAAGRLGAAAAGAAILPLLTYGWSAVVFARSAGEGWLPDWLRFLRGLRPGLDLSSLGAPRLGASFLASWERISESVAAAPPVAVGLVAAAALLVVALRRSGPALPWLAWLLPYLLYETALGINLDRGIYVMFVAPPLAALVGIAAGEIRLPEGWRRRRLLAAGALLVLASLLVAPALQRSYQQGAQVVSRAEFLQRPILRQLRWLGDNLPDESLLIQPSWLPNRNLAPAYSGLRPVFWRRGHYHAFRGGAWRPLNFGSYERLTPERIDELLEGGTPIVSLERIEWFSRPPSRVWVEQSIDVDGARAPYFVLTRR